MANWKMEITIAESLAYLHRFREQAGRLTTQVQVILCPPYTSLCAMAQALGTSPIELGAQTVSAAAGGLARARFRPGSWPTPERDGHCWAIGNCVVTWVRRTRL